MSKTTPEEAIVLAQKHGLRLTRGDIPQLANLIDEVRGVDAEPVGYRWKWNDGILDATHPLAGWQIGSGPPDIHPANKDYITVEPVFTRPAPSQPAAPVAEVRTSLKKCVADAKETSGAYWKAYAESLAEDFDALTTQYLALKNVAPVELPVVAWVDPYDLIEKPEEKDCEFGTSGVFTTKRSAPQELGLVKLSDAQAAIATGRKV